MSDTVYEFIILNVDLFSSLNCILTNSSWSFQYFMPFSQLSTAIYAQCWTVEQYASVCNTPLFKTQLQREFHVGSSQSHPLLLFESSTSKFISYKVEEDWAVRTVIECCYINFVLTYDVKFKLHCSFPV